VEQEDAMSEPDETWYQMVRVGFRGTDEQVAAFHQWYEETHIPAMTATPGIRSCTRFAQLDSASDFLAIWEIDHPSVYQHPTAKAAAGWAEFAPNIEWCTVGYAKREGDLRRFGTAADPS
jgi:hypothetical protein